MLPRPAPFACPCCGPSRRGFLAGLAGLMAAAAAPLPAWADTAPTTTPTPAEGELYWLFDQLAAERAQAGFVPGSQAEALRAFPVAGLGSRGDLDRRAVLDALEREAALRRAWPHGVAANRPSPYSVSLHAGTHRTVLAALRQPDPATAQRLTDALDRETERVRAEAAAGVILPAALLAQALDRLRATRDRVGEAGVAAALDRQITVLEGQAGSAPDRAGLSRLPGGGDAYAAILSVTCTEDISADAAHRMAADLAGSFTAEAERLFAGLGLRDGTLGSRFRQLAARPEHRYPDSPAGREQAVADMNAHLPRIRPLLPTLFGELPQAEITVRQLTAAEIEAGRQGWRDDPSFDGRKPGGYIVDLSRIAERPRWALPTMTDHETLPGHLLQSAWAERAGIHPFRARFFSGAVLEGWSTYAQTLMAEAGVYDSDPAARLGYLQSVLFRIGRMLADTSLHARGWSREQAAATIADLGGEPADVVAAEVDRMAVLPGFLTGHMTGYVRTLEMRERMRQAHASRFDLRRFHDGYLSPGPLPVAVLTTHVAAL